MRPASGTVPIPTREQRDTPKADDDLTSLAQHVATNAELRREEETVTSTANEESKLNHRVP